MPVKIISQFGSEELPVAAVVATLEDGDGPRPIKWDLPFPVRALTDTDDFPFALSGIDDPDVVRPIKWDQPVVLRPVPDSDDLPIPVTFGLDDDGPFGAVHWDLVWVVRPISDRDELTRIVVDDDPGIDSRVVWPSGNLVIVPEPDWDETENPNLDDSDVVLRLVQWPSSFTVPSTVGDEDELQLVTTVAIDDSTSPIRANGQPAWFVSNVAGMDELYVQTQLGIVRLRGRRIGDGFVGRRIAGLAGKRLPS